ncbi:hypothetical protein O0L34_g4586 [Tuta absoluta]|nr:hypothetical protein O0L34_g4586 [Tuta absoluta]
MVLTLKIIVLIPTETKGVHISRIITNRVCTCSLIQRNWVLIAAHCLLEVKTYGKDFFKVVYGDLTISPTTTKFQRNIRKFVTYGGFFVSFDMQKLKNDIALLLIDPIYNLPVGKISAIDYKSLVGYSVTYLGAGGTFSLSNVLNEKQKIISEIIKKDQTRPLQQGKAVVVTCDKLKTLFQAVYPAICLYSKCSNSRQGAMPGDSGGPLLFKGIIVGVASMTGPGTISLPLQALKEDIGDTGSVYTAVSPFLNWINNVIAEERNYTNYRRRSVGFRKARKEAYFTII